MEEQKTANQAIEIYEKQPYGEFVKEVVGIGAPVVVQSILGSLVNMLDVMMIGQLGEVAITASALSNQWHQLYFLLANALCAAGSMFISQYWGKKDTGSIHQFMGIIFYGVSCLAAVFFLTSFLIPGTILGFYSKDPLVIEQGVIYLRILSISFPITLVTIVLMTGLRGIGETKVPMVASALSVVTNGALNYILIFGKLFAPALGIKGAAIATVIARVMEFAVIVSYVLIKKPPIYGSRKSYLSVSGELWKKYFKVGSWVILAEGLYAVGSNLYNVAYKYTGTEAQASLQIVNTYQGLATIMCGGFGTAAAVMIGTRLGKDNFEGAKNCCRRLLVFSFVISLVIAGIVFLLAPYVPGLFQVNGTVTSYLNIMFKFMAAAIPLRIIVFVCIVGVLRSGGDSTVCFIANMVGVWCVGLPLVFLTAVYLELPIYIVYLASIAEEFAKFLISFPRVLRNKWMNNLT